MSITLFQLGAIASIFLAIHARPNDRPGYIDCLDSSECGRGKCCSIGMGRYSIPQCFAMGNLGDKCIPDNKLHKMTTLSYPDGSSMNLTNFYFHHICPCLDNLICNKDTETCEDPLFVSFNYIDY
ncbi:unnamed protein product [Nezara viridula]|uniref:Prokineticin domain-containing protein n=1 Tax=Nezara viridula TaxID=85310 RepID=A0A9P0H9N7_NEZVI|nr:unnamed protein product [Nezara viridula]